jgi:hypothetical protein
MMFAKAYDTDGIAQHLQTNKACGTDDVVGTLGVCLMLVTRLLCLSCCCTPMPPLRFRAGQLPEPLHPAVLPCCAGAVPGTGPGAAAAGQPAHRVSCGWPAPAPGCRVPEASEGKPHPGEGQQLFWAGWEYRLESSSHGAGTDFRYFSLPQSYAGLGCRGAVCCAVVRLRSTTRRCCNVL